MKQNVKKICKLCLVSCFSAGALLSLNSCESTEPPHSTALWEEDNTQTDVALLQQKNALQTINYINWLCALVNPGELENYHFNKIDLEFAYQTLTPDSLNFRSIPDKTSVALIQDIENYILELRIAKKDRDLLEELYKREKRKAFFAVLPTNMAVIVDANWKQLLANVAQTLFYSYMNYRKIKESIEIQYQKDSWELDKGVLNSIHKRNLAMLNHQWNLENDFGIDDSKRVSEKDARELLKYVHRANSEVGEISHVYNILKGEEDKYAYFPIYWYYRGCYAYTYDPRVKISELSREEKKDRELRIKDAQKCFEKYQDLVAGLLRKNPMLADVAVRSIQLELINSTGFLRKNFIKKQLEIIENNILLEKDEDKYLFCGLVYLKILKEPLKAVSFFEKAEGFLRMGYKDGLHDFVGELEDKTELTLENNQGLSVENASADNSKRMMPGADLLFFSRFSRYYSQIKASPEDFIYIIQRLVKEPETNLLEILFYGANVETAKNKHKYAVELIPQVLGMQVSEEEYPELKISTGRYSAPVGDKGFPYPLQMSLTYHDKWWSSDVFEFTYPLNFFFLRSVEYHVKLQKETQPISAYKVEMPHTVIFLKNSDLRQCKINFKVRLDAEDIRKSGATHICFEASHKLFNFSVRYAVKDFLDENGEFVDGKTVDGYMQFTLKKAEIQKLKAEIDLQSNSLIPSSRQK